MELYDSEEEDIILWIHTQNLLVGHIHGWFEYHQTYHLNKNMLPNPSTVVTV